MIPKFLINLVGETTARFLTLVFAVLLVSLVVGFITRSCSADDPAPQARQDVKSSDAVASAATEAVATVVASGERDKSIDTVVTEAVKEIDNAPNPVAARAAVVGAVCGMRAYRDRPECALQRANP